MTFKTDIMQNLTSVKSTLDQILLEKKLRFEMEAPISWICFKRLKGTCL